MADREKLEKMSEAMHLLAKPEAAMRIANLLTSLADSKPRGSAPESFKPVD
jgi:UDP-N-acetylglucosamine:LPS N-acetylglucosamine transferase